MPRTCASSTSEVAVGSGRVAPDDIETSDKGRKTACQDVTTTEAGHRRGCLGAIEPIEIQEEMERSFLEYSMSVIVSRALPTCGTAEAGTPPDPVLDVRPAAAARPTPHQVRQGVAT